MTATLPEVQWRAARPVQCGRWSVTVVRTVSDVVRLSLRLTLDSGQLVTVTTGPIWFFGPPTRASWPDDMALLCAHLRTVEWGHLPGLPPVFTDAELAQIMDVILSYADEMQP